MTVKILLDTDIGSDIDDALCLAYLLAQPECELLGVTTVSGEATKRASMVSALCKIAGKNIPIFPGIEYPLLTPIKQPHATQARALTKWDHETSFPKGEAIEFLRRTIRSHPGEITLLGIGPMTNIAVLFASDPEIPTLLKSLVLMCGQFTRKEPEWNALNDPYATAIVYRAGVTQHRSLGLDVTMQVQMKAAEFRERCQVPLLRPVLDFAEVWFQHTEMVTFHDPLAATTIFDDSICPFTAGNVEIEFLNPQEGGRTIWQSGGAETKHEVALSVNPDRFFSHYFGILT